MITGDEEGMCQASIADTCACCCGGPKKAPLARGTLQAIRRLEEWTANNSYRIRLRPYSTLQYPTCDLT